MGPDGKSPSGPAPHPGTVRRAPPLLPLRAANVGANDTAALKSWTPPMSPLRAVFKEETHQGARDPLSVRRVSTNRGVVASLTRSRGARFLLMTESCCAEGL